MVTHFLVVAMALTAVISFSAEAAQRRADKTEQPAAAVLVAGEKAPVLKFQTIATGVPPETTIGKRMYGFICSLGGKAEDIRTTKTIQLDMRGFGNSFRQEFEAAHYQMIGEDVALFGPQQNDAKYQVGAVVKDIKLDSCYSNPGANPSATASISVEWQFYDPLERKVVYRATSAGNAKLGTTPDGENKAVNAAFVDAVHTLLTTQQLHDFLNPVSLPGAAQNAALPAAPLFKLKPIPASTARFQEHATDVRAHVATVFSNDGTGSGFFVNDGYLITNNHVVDGAKFVKVKLLTGREVVGEVVATDAHRDVALVKTEAIGLKGLPVRVTEAGIGSQVFVIGSPLGVANEGTVTSGIISTYRVEKEQRIIQSDAAVTHGNSGGPMVDDTGNVIGITVYGRIGGNGQDVAGLNFFIPITDALDKLGITLAAN